MAQNTEETKKGHKAENANVTESKGGGDVVPEQNEAEKPKGIIQKEPEKINPDEVKFVEFRAESDVSITCRNKYGNFETFNFQAGDKVQIADVPGNIDTIRPFIERNHLKKL
jgi:hypothetical protein